MSSTICFLLKYSFYGSYVWINMHFLDSVKNQTRITYLISPTESANNMWPPIKTTLESCQKYLQGGSLNIVAFSLYPNRWIVPIILFHLKNINFWFPRGYKVIGLTEGFQTTTASQFITVARFSLSTVKKYTKRNSVWDLKCYPY